MERQIYLFELPDRFITGTVGMPGERVFYLQAEKSSQITTVVLEKNQVALLCERMDALLDQLQQSEAVSDDLIPDTHNESSLDLAPLNSPVLEEFRVGTIAIGFHSEKRLITIEAHQDTGGLDVPDLESQDLMGPNLLRVRITPEQARNFAERGRRLVSAGRPPCPFCQLPLDPQGHICPRANGYRR
jgi:uncharacterized repeat protein (TIGR03847 family)